jgi:exosortase family protein XrtM
MIPQLRGWWQRQDATKSLGRFRNEFTFALLFLAIFAVLSSLYAMARDTAVERLLIDELTVKPAAALIALVAPNEQVAAQGYRLVSPQARLSVRNACEGIETMLLLASAILAYRASWRDKAWGVMLGTLLVYALNQLRIVSLFYAFRHDRAFFEALHGYVAPVILILLAGVYFLWWLSRYSTVPHGPAGPA